MVIYLIIIKSFIVTRAREIKKVLIRSTMYVQNRNCVMIVMDRHNYTFANRVLSHFHGSGQAQPGKDDAVHGLLFDVAPVHKLLGQKLVISSDKTVRFGIRGPGRK